MRVGAEPVLVTAVSPGLVRSRGLLHVDRHLGLEEARHAGAQREFTRALELRPGPCRCSRASAPQIHQSLLLRGLSLVGWYHSHPHSPALPSLQDIDAQMDYQLRLQGSSNGFQPCLALLCCTSGAGAECMC